MFNEYSWRYFRNGDDSSKEDLMVQMLAGCDAMNSNLDTQLVDESSLSITDMDGITDNMELSSAELIGNTKL